MAPPHAIFSVDRVRIFAWTQSGLAWSPKNGEPFWPLAPGSWLLTPGSWLLTPGSWLLAPDSWFLAPGSWLLAATLGFHAPPTRHL